MGLRVVKDVVADVYRDGALIHSKARVQKDDTGRVAVWLANAPTAPDHVYLPSDEITWQNPRTPCSCKRDIPKVTLMRAWAKSETVANV